MQRRLRPKRFVIPCLYLILFTTVAIGAFLISKSMKKNIVEDNYTYVSNVITEREIQVINETKKIIKPYTNEKVTVGKNFYDYKAESKAQEGSLTYYDGSYIQNSGIDYISDEVFEIVSIMDGTVTDVKQDDVLGNIIEIKHGNDYVSTYQSLSEVSVKKGDNITQGQVIGKSGINKLDKDMGNHLHFELYTNGQVVDPNLYIDKEIKSE